ncbi:properdin [Nematolebias whitei]|uniref:properdin n=1 Tax=Nematolebias whitei TaxID=451745 RepID=UPI00189A8A1A|nr:properdin [Nematolebias whitei]
MMEPLRVLLILVPLLVSVERSECLQCFGFFNLNSGECEAEIGDVEEDDCCQNPNYGYKREDGVCQSCGPPAWSPWSSWSFCNVLCGEGVRQRSRACYGIGESQCEKPADVLHVEPCNGTCCNEQGWSSWLPWTPCSVSCEGEGVRKRLRVCASPPECQAGCTGPPEETETCDLSHKKCPVHGSWSRWTDWSSCSGSCINDQPDSKTMPSRERQRSCSNPAPSTDTEPQGNSCPGDSVQKQDCSELPNCPVDGNWGAWSAPGPCSVTCGEGLQLSLRMCDSPAPKYGGKVCEGSSTQSNVCQSPCPVHGFWSGWSNWGECSSSCIPQNQFSSRTRHRSCSNPTPSSNPRGHACEGEATQRENCDHLPYCPVNGNWGSWSPYTPCPVTCGVGLQVSVRSCDNPSPKHGGQPCPGEERQTTICSTNVHCPVHGVWSEWSTWGTCKYPFGDKDIHCKPTGGRQSRERTCLHRAHNGSFCEGNKLLDSQVCYDVNNCREVCQMKGTWDGWGAWRYCTPSCGEKSRRVRFLICKPDYSDYRKTIGRQKEEAAFSGTSKPDCGQVPDGMTKYEFQNCLNVPPCTN